MASNKKLVSLKNLKHFLDYLRTKFTAPMAKCDEDGNIIADTYLPAKNVMKDGERDFTGKIPKVDAHDALQISTDMTFNKEISGKNKQATLKFDGARLVSDVPIQAQLVGTMDTTVKEALKADSVEWRDVLHAPDMNNYALKDEGLQVHNLGVDKTKPYTMNYKDFNKVGIYHIYYGDANAMPKDCPDNLWIFKLDNTEKDSTLLAAATGTNDSYVGHFLNGVWKGWHKTGNTGERIVLPGFQTSWVYGRNSAGITITTCQGYRPVMSVKSKTGSWESGVYDSDDLQFVFVSDADYAANNNTAKCWITLKSDGSIVGNLIGTANIANYVNNDYKPMRMHWNGQAGQPAWLWGGDDGINMYVYNPANFTVNIAKNIPTSDVGGNIWIS